MIKIIPLSTLTRVFTRDLKPPLSNVALLDSMEKYPLPSKYLANQKPDIPSTPTKCAYLKIESGNNTIGLMWAAIKNSGSKGLVSEVPVVRMG